MGHNTFMGIGSKKGEGGEGSKAFRKCYILYGMSMAVGGGR